MPTAHDYKFWIRSGAKQELVRMALDTFRKHASPEDHLYIDEMIAQLDVIFLRRVVIPGEPRFPAQWSDAGRVLAFLWRNGRPATNHELMRTVLRGKSAEHVWSISSYLARKGFVRKTSEGALRLSPRLLARWSAEAIGRKVDRLRRLAKRYRTIASGNEQVARDLKRRFART